MLRITCHLQSHASTITTYCFSRQVLDALSATAVSYCWGLMSLWQVPSTPTPKILASKPWLPLVLALEPCPALGAGRRIKSSMAPSSKPLAKVAAPKLEQSCVPTGVLLLYNHMLKITVA